MSSQPRSFSRGRVVVQWGNISHRLDDNQEWALLDPVYEVAGHSTNEASIGQTPENSRYIEFTAQGVSFAQMNGKPNYDASRNLGQIWTRWKVTFRPDQISNLWAKEYQDPDGTRSILEIGFESAQAPEGEPIVEKPDLDANQMQQDSLGSDDPENFPLAKLTKSFGEAASRQIKLHFFRSKASKGGERWAWPVVVACLLGFGSWTTRSNG